MIKIVGDKELDIDISDLELEERYDSELYKTTTLFFICPKEILNDKYPEAESTEISVEFITEDPYNCEYDADGHIIKFGNIDIVWGTEDELGNTNEALSETVVINNSGS